MVNLNRCLAAMPLCFFMFMLYTLDMLVTNPTCQEFPHYIDEETLPGYSEIESDVKIMMVGDLLLSGSQAGYFEEILLHKFFVQALRDKNPDAVIVVGDLSARGADTSVLKQFKRFLGSSSVQAYHHAVMGDKDIGGCSKLNKAFFESLSKELPVFRSSGSGSASILINGVHFFSLNSMALVCENNDLRSTVERELREERTLNKVDLSWMRDNTTSYGYGPFLILHFPLYPKLENSCTEIEFLDRGIFYTGTEISELGTGRVELTKTLAENDTQHILQNLRPRMVFSGHAQRYCDRVHPDGIPEITVPPMTWDDGNVPAFVLVTFKTDGTVTTDLCRFLVEYEVGLMCLYLASMAIVAIETERFLLQIIIGWM